MKNMTAHDSSNTSLANSAVPATMQASTPMDTPSVSVVEPMDAETKRDIQIKMTLAQNALKEGQIGATERWLRKAQESLAEFRQYRTAA